MPVCGTSLRFREHAQGCHALVNPNVQVTDNALACPWTHALWPIYGQSIWCRFVDGSEAASCVDYVIYEVSNDTMTRHGPNSFAKASICLLMAPEWQLHVISASAMLCLHLRLDRIQTMPGSNADSDLAGADTAGM